jgi:hypothetical protein
VAKIFALSKLYYVAQEQEQGGLGLPNIAVKADVQDDSSAWGGQLPFDRILAGWSTG